ncbi:MAG: methyltransferase domain-containing protein [Haloferacaceae archaeon]
MELGGEDDAFAALEARSVAPDAAVVAPGLATAPAVDAGRAPRLAYTRAVSRLVGRTDATVASARAVVEAATRVEGTVAVRARDVRKSAGVDTQAAERELGRALVEGGHEVDLDCPDNVLRAAFAGGTCLVGWQVATRDGGYGARRPTERPFFQPGGMDPLDARALVNVAGARPGATVLDPMCGTGGTLIEAGLVGAEAVGVDAQAKMVRGARENCRAYVDDGVLLCRGDATALPLADDSCDAVVFDAPYGRQSKVVGDLATLVAGALREARRVAPRAVVVADESLEAAAREAGWTVGARHERRVHRSLVRHVHVLDAERERANGGPARRDDRRDQGATATE